MRIIRYPGKRSDDSAVDGTDIGTKVLARKSGGWLFGRSRRKEAEESGILLGEDEVAYDGEVL